MNYCSRLLFLLACLLFLYNSSRSQNPLIKQWDYRFGGMFYEELRAMQQTFDNGYIIGGFSESGVGGDKTEPSWGQYDYWVVKTDSLGIMTWDKRFGGTQDDHLFSLQQTRDSGYMLGGYSLSGISGNKTQPAWGEDDFWIIKTDGLGNVEWDRRFGGTLDEELYSLQETTDGGYILGGHSDSDISGNKTQDSWGGSNDFWMVKTDSLGNMLWDKRFGGTNDDYLLSLSQTSDGGYILGGYANSGISGDKTQSSWGGYDYWVVKTDSLGNYEWDARFGGTNADILFSLQQTTDGGYILAGRSESGINGNKTVPSYGNADYWIVKIDSLGVMQWDKAYGGINPEDDFGNISQTSDQGYLLAGTSYSNISGVKTEENLASEQTWVVKTDSLGNLEWDKTIFTKGHDETGYAIQIDEGCYVIANHTHGDSGGYKTQDNWFNNTDYWIVKFCDSTFFLSPPDAFLSSNDSDACQYSCLDFFDQSLYSPASWQWYFDGGIPATSSLQNPSQICYNLDGVFDITLITCNQSGCDTITFSNLITIYSLPSPSIIVSGNVLNSTVASLYQWFFEGNIIPGATNQSYTAIQSGLYSVAVTDANSCTGSDTIEIHLTQFSSADTLICEKFCVDFIDGSVNNPTSWLWLFPGGIPSFSADPNPVDICYNTPGTYDVTLITTHPFGIDTLTLSNYISVYPTPPIPVISQNGNTLTSSPADFYQWLFNAVDIPGATGQSYTVTQTGFYTVIITDTNGCFASSTLYVGLTAIEDLGAEFNLSVYPNPTNGKIVIKCKNNLLTAISEGTLQETKEISFEVRDPIGQLIFSCREKFSFADWEKEIDINIAASGCCFLEIKSDQFFIKKKIIILRDN